MTGSTRKWRGPDLYGCPPLHLACVIFKSSPLIGLGLLVGLVAAALQWKAKPEIRVLLLIVVCYSLGLVLLPLAQTFYMMPVLPLLAILGADQLLTLVDRRKALAYGLTVMAVTGLCIDLALCYPDFNLNGYQWLGARYLENRSTIGYRSVVQTTSDGVQQAAQWLNENARPGDRVVVYAYEWHILEAVCPDPEFRLVRGERNSVRLRPDYVIIHINHTSGKLSACERRGKQRPRRERFWTPYDEEWLHPLYQNRHTPGLGIEMASVWEKNNVQEHVTLGSGHLKEPFVWLRAAVTLPCPRSRAWASSLTMKPRIRATTVQETLRGCGTWTDWVADRHLWTAQLGCSALATDKCAASSRYRKTNGR